MIAISAKRCLPAAAVLVAVCLAPGGRAAAERIDFGTVDSIALDQPRVLVGFFGDINDPENTFVGPDFLGNLFLLDTGANGVLIGQLGHFDFDDPDFFNPDLYELEQRDGQNVQYIEQGVAGFSVLNLTIEYDLFMNGHDGDAFDLGATSERLISPVRSLSSADLGLGSFGGIVGMPAMAGRRTEMDLTTMTPLGFMAVTFPEGVPPANSADASAVTHRVNGSGFIPLSFDGQVDPADPLPTFSEIPLLEVTAAHNALTHTDDYVFDTGAQLSLITADTAAALNIDPVNDALDFLPVSGIGGTIDMPLVHIQEISLLTDAGDELVFTDWVVGVLDIPGLEIGGIFGMNALTTGYFQHVLAEEDMDGAFLSVALDFTGEDWFMELVTNEAFVPSDTPLPIEDAMVGLAGDLVFLGMDPTSQSPLFTVIPEPATLGLLALGALSLAGGRRRSARR